MNIDFINNQTKTCLICDGKFLEKSKIVLCEQCKNEIDTKQ